MVYRISLIVSTTLCALLILISLYALIIEQDYSGLSLTIITVISVMTGITLFLNFFCIRLNKINKAKLPISLSMKRFGKAAITLSVINCIAILFFTATAFIEFYQGLETGTSSNIFPLIFSIVLFFLWILTTILNIINYSRAVRKNKFLIAELIGEIGNQS